MKKILFVFTLSLILAATGYVFSAGYYGTTNSGATGTYDGTGAENITTTNLTATSANVTTLTAANAVFTASNTTGVMAANVINASGTLTAVPSSTSPIMFGNTTPVNTSTGATFPTATKTQISKAGAFTNAAVGDLILVTGGTGATTGQYRLTTKTSNDLVVVDRNIHASGTDITDGAFTVYKDVITIRNTDGTNGQMIASWSHQNKPLQIGGSSFITASASATRDTVVLGGADGYLYGSYTGNIGLKGKTVYLAPENGTYLVFFDTNYGTSLAFSADNTVDIGNVSTYRPKTGYFGTSLKVADAAITAGSGTGVTVNETGALRQQVYKVTTTYAAYSDSDLTKGIVIATLPAKTRLVAAYADTTVAYAGTDITAATLEVGVTAEGAAEILATGNVFAGAILLGDADAEMGTAMTRAAKEQGAYMPSFTGTTAIYATIDATTGAATTLANLTAGSTTFYLITERLP